MKLKNKKIWGVVLLLLIILVIVAFIILSLPLFGGKIAEGRLERVKANPMYQEGGFVNVEPQAPFSISEVWSFLTESFFYDEIRIPPFRIPVVPVSASSLNLLTTPTLRAFWIGHASVYVEIDGIRMLIDPVFSDHASPFAIGPKRFHPPPIKLHDLPQIDAVVIARDHYDHFDMSFIKGLCNVL